MDTSRVDGVKAPLHNDAEIHHDVLVFVEGDATVERVFARDSELVAGREGLRGRREGDGGKQTHGKVVRFAFTDLLRQSLGCLCCDRW